jgi:hypothetical protein
MCRKQTGRVDEIKSSGIWACPECRQKLANEKDLSLFYVTIPPHSACEIRWASQENSEQLDSKILCGGPLRIAVIAD